MIRFLGAFRGGSWENFVSSEWGGLDTLVISAGVSALRPLLEVAGVERRDGAFYPLHAGSEGVRCAVSAGTAAMQGNYVGPLICAVTFVSTGYSLPDIDLTCTYPIADTSPLIYLSGTFDSPDLVACSGRPCTDTFPLRVHKGRLTSTLPISGHRASFHSFHLRSSQHCRGRFPSLRCRWWTRP